MVISRRAPGKTYASILEVLRERAEELPDELAFDFNDQERTTFGELFADAGDLARGLAARGLKHGDHCAIVLPMSLDQIRLVFATQLAGAAPVLLDPAAPPKLLKRRLLQAHPKLAMVDGALIDAVAAEFDDGPPGPSLILPSEVVRRRESEGPELPPVSPEDKAYLQFTSGTTGDPKAVVITHRNLGEYLRLHYAHVRPPASEVLLSWTPLFHDLGLVGFVFLSLYVGCPGFLLPPEIKSLGVWLQTASRVRATAISCPDFGYRIVTRSVRPDGLDLSSIRMSGSGGEPVRIDTIRRFEERFGLEGTSVGGYGQAETVMCLTMGLPEEPLRVDAEGNIANGRALPGVELRIVDESGQALGPGKVGEITARGPTIFAGYLDDEAASREAVRQGWLYTGDTGYLDEEGYLFILGRKKALIKRGGSFISPREVEMTADQVPGVRFSAAVGVPGASSLSSEDLVVVAEADPAAVESPEDRSALAEAVAAAVHEQVGHAPADVIFLKPHSIPRTANGKVRHLALKHLLSTGDARFESRILR